MVTVASQRYVGALILMNTMMIRAKVFVGDRVSNESIRTFFFGVTHDLPVVSLAVDASNFDSRMVTFWDGNQSPQLDGNCVTELSILGIQRLAGS